MNSDAIIESVLSALLLPALQAQTLRCSGPLVCYVCPQFFPGNYTLVCLAAKFPISCHLAQCLAHGSLKRMLAELDYNFVHFSEMTQPAQCFTFYPAFVLITSLALHISSLRFVL